MRTRSKSYPFNSTATIPRRSNRRRVPNIVEPEIRTIEEVVSMADRTMEELLQAPTKGYGEAIIISKILAENFEIKTNLLQLVQANKFHGFERGNPHTHISNFKRMTATLKYRDVPNDAIKLMLFPYSLEGFFTPSKTTHLKNEISRFTQRFEETFGEAWDRFKEMLRACPHHGFSELTQIDTFYNGLHEDSVSKTDDRIDKLADQILNLVEIINKQVITPASAKAVEKTCVTCGGAHAYYDCIATDSNQPSVCAVVEQNTEETTDKEHSNCPGSTAHVQPPKLREKAMNQMEKFFQIFYDLHFDISFADTLLLMPKFASTIKSLLTNKDKLFDLAKVPLNEKCSAMLLKKLPEKLEDPKLTPTRMTLELVDRSITRPKGVVEDIFVKVGKFHFPTNFVVVDFEADPRVPLIIGRSFLRTVRDLIHVYEEEITLRVNDESVTFNLNQTMRYSSTYDDNSVNRVHVIDIACEEFVQDVLDFQYNSKSSNPTLVSDTSIPENDFSKEPIVKSSLPTLTLFRESDFFLEEFEDFLNDDSILTGIENSVYDPEGDILFLEKLLNEDPFRLPSMDLKLAEETKANYSIEGPPELELKELPSHLEYAFLENYNKLPVIIAKDLKDVKKEALIKILKSQKRAIAWKISDIKVVQSQRRVNPKIHDLIKKEVIKLLDAGMIYPISNSPWVSPIHCIPKKGGMTVVANENNELIPTRFVTGWRVCIDYRKLNDAIRKDHFSLPFMDQMLERLAGNEFYCFLDGFSGEGIVLGHKILKYGIEVNRAKVDVIAKLPHPTTVKGVRSFVGHAGFYCRFIQDFSKFARPMTHVLEKETPFVFSKECVNAFNTLKKKLTEALILVVPDWNLPFELMCDASDFAIGAVLGQHKTKHFQPIHYASKTMTEAQIHYTKTEKEMLTVVYAFEKFQPYLVLSKSIVYTDHSALKYFLNKEDAKSRLLRWVLLLQEFDITILDIKGYENLVADHLLRLDNPHKDVLENKDINENFPLETLGSLSCDSTPWFADIANFHARNFIKKGLTSQQKKKFFKDLLKSSKLAMRDLLGAIMVPVSQRRRQGKISQRDKMPQNAIQVCEIFDWVEAKSLPTNDARVVVKFLKSLFPRFGIPRAIISDHGTHFCNDQFTRVMIKYGVTHRLATAYHPHSSGQVETVDDHRKLQLNELSEIRDQAYENSVIYKERTKKLHDSKIKNRIFNVGDQVFLFNSHLKIFSGKLKTRWSGPFTITQVFPYGTIELSQPNDPNFKVNGHRVKHYFRGDIPSNVVSDLYTFPMDK
nr:reverse transcriptase domain-containing protein [Tanacetum cinerariifolium]